MISKEIFRDEKGVSVVLGAILILGMLAAVFPIWYNYYVESTMKSKETNHMDTVRDQYFELQSKVSWMDGPETGGKVKIPMNAGSVRFFPGQSPAGTLTIDPGSDINVENTGVQEIITVDPGSITFVGQNIYFPTQTYIFEGGHVFLVQGEAELMASPNEELILWGDSLEVKYPKVVGEEESISSMVTESVTLAWGGRNRFPENMEWKNADNIRINFETRYENVWVSYLEEKAENIENATIFAEADNYENGAYLQIFNDNIRYLVCATETGEDVEVTNPTVETLENGEVWADAATLRMSYDFNDYAYGETRFKWRKENGTWSATGWSSQYGADDNYSELITGIRRNTTYEYKAQIKYDSKNKEGKTKTFYTGNKESYGGDGGRINPPSAARLVGAEKTSNDTMYLTFRNTGDNTIHFGDSVVAFYKEEIQNKTYEDWSSTTLGIGPSPIGGEWKSPTNQISIPENGETGVSISFSPTDAKFDQGEFFVYKAEFSNGTQNIYFVNVETTATGNTTPNSPSNPSPSDGATLSETTSTTLSVNVSDPDGDSMNVSFYDASDDSIIGTDSGVIDGGTASVTWDSLSAGSSYDWYAVADDGTDSTTSSTWSFTVNTAPDSPTNPSPSDGAVLSSGTSSTTLSVDVSDPDGDSMDVTFYTGEGTEIGTDTGVSSGGTASTTYNGLSDGNTYDWYAEADDGHDVTTSSTYSFTIGSVTYSYTYVDSETIYEGGTANFSNAQQDDGNFENIYETDQNPQPGQGNIDYRENVQHNIVNVSGNNPVFQIEYMISNDTGESVDIYLENFTSGNWDHIGQLSSISLDNFEYNMPSDYISATDNIHVRYVQPTDDSARTDLLIDYCRVRSET
ncbi:hypothetical protein AKJ50_00155 [candidate division MSBL1 archaeon SCGC-AAA382A13]|uniref:Fibronectin type-III domain-containing protein n=1 Tax=candidate division MSBL1 archaeon SCGC-AAA382A13 TaxID=1698279 RepID=A0A133VGV9_9EURY|nr:hypothetical protein AKJ50_00155 [candidate division MSBL1 archaeon SCGC-AAA382A13]